MTDTSSLLITHSTPQLLPVTATSLASPTLNGSLSDTLPVEDDEPYTIKCICAFSDDDGNTVFCEKCETWQHIECYYHGKKVPEVHNCADCEPRLLDARRATERQKRLREQSDGGDRKPKRPASKSHKKKIKDNSSTEQTNGWHDRQESASVGRDLPPPAKRPKTSHRTSNSVNSTNGTPILHSESRKRATSSAHNYPSPTKSPNNHYPPMPMYSQEFLHLYDHDSGKDNLGLKDNFNTINVARKLQAWLSDPVQLSSDAHGLKHDDVFTSAESDNILDESNLPPVSRHSKINSDVEYDGRYPKWQYLVLDAPVGKDAIVGEIKGSVGHFEEYCLDGANRWQELRHPEPFVFFHPQLPIYIDSRREGTQFRYLRRSCKPNVTMKTYITGETEYHFCFVAKDDIPAGTELTASWYLDQNLFNKSGIVKEEPINDGETDPPWLWVSRVLANFGDCACDSAQRCPFANLDRRYHPRPLDTRQTNGKKRGKRKKHVGSPLAAGGGMGSRAGSENVKTQDDDEADSRSTSGSIRSKPQSRDMTPTSGGVLDHPNVIIGLSDREKRKIAMAEKNFERLEQDQQVQKKKKRPSGGSSVNTPSISTSKHLVHSASLPPTPSILRPNGMEPYAANHGSGSPASRAPLSRNGQSTSPPRSLPLTANSIRAVYVDCAMQTDQDTLDNTFLETAPGKRRKFTPLTQRLLKRCLEDRRRSEQLSPPSIDNGALGKIPISPASSNPTDIHTQDVEVKDSALSISTSPSPSLQQRAPTPPPDQPPAVDTPRLHLLPSQAAHTAAVRRFHPPDHSVRPTLASLPPVPSFPSMPSNSTSTNGTPLGGTGAKSPLTLTTTNIAPALPHPGIGTQSPIVAPSPVKKKLSLGDYMSRRSASMTTPVTEKSAAAAALGNSIVAENPFASSAPTLFEDGPQRLGETIAEEETQAIGGQDGEPIGISDARTDRAQADSATALLGDTVITKSEDVEMPDALSRDLGDESALAATALISADDLGPSRDPRLQ